MFQRKEKILENKDIFLTKDDKVDIMRTIYFVGLSQFIAVIVAIITIINFMMK